MGRVVTTISGDASQLTAEQKKVAEAASKMSAEFRKIDTDVKTLDRTTQRWLKAIATDQEKYNAKLAELDVLLKKGTISSEQYERAVAKIGEELGDTGTSFLEAFGEKSIAKLSAWSAGFVSVTAVINAGVQALTAFREESQKIGDALQDRFFTRGQLMQVASDQQDFQRLLQMSDQFMKSGAVTEGPQADRLVFALRSTGQEQFAEMFGRLAQSGLVENLEGLINATDSLKDAFGTAETGTPEQLASKALAVGAFSQRDLQTIASAAAAAGASAAKIGLSDEEALAVVGALADPLKTAETAATRLRALSTAAQRQGVAGGSLFELLDNIEEGAKRAGKTVLDFLGQQEATEIFDLLRQPQNASAVREAIKLAQQANDNVELRKKVDALLGDTRQQSVIRRRIADGSLAVTEDQTGRGVMSNLRQSLETAGERLEEAQGVGWFGQWMGSANAWMSRWIDPNALVVTAGQEAVIRNQAMREGNQEVIEALNNILEVQRLMLTTQQQAADENRRRPTAVTVPTPEN